MSRRSKPQKRIPMPDPVYNSKDIAKLLSMEHIISEWEKILVAEQVVWV